MNRLLIGFGHLRRLLHRGPKTEQELIDLAEGQDPLAFRLACSLRRAVDNSFSEEVYDAFDRIETIRRRYAREQAAPNVPATQAQLRRWAKRGSNRARWGRLLYATVEGMEPETCVEFGGLIGLSGAYQALALSRNGEGTLQTIERRPAGVQLASQHFDELGLSDHAEVLAGDFFERLPEVREHRPIDYVFVDGDHTIDQTLRLFHELLSDLSDGALVVLDDITWSWGMRKAWKLIQRHPRVSLSVDLFNLGVLLVRDEEHPTEQHKIALP